MQYKMKRFSKRVISAVCAVAMVLTGLLGDIGTLAMTAKAEEKHTLWVVGDSTVCDYIKSDGTHTDSTYYYPRYGYGTQLANYLDGTYEVKNLALSGRSSKSFTSEANYTTLKNGIKEGDALVVGFGHNDEKSENSSLYTSGTGTWETEGSFAKSLYDNYVVLAKEKRAEVFLCTPIVRRSKTGTFSDTELHVTTNGDYPQAIRDLGTAQDVPVVDLTALTKSYYENLGSADATLKLHAWLSSKEASVDNTHLNLRGAKRVAWLFANAVQGMGSTELSKHISLEAGEPDIDEEIKNGLNYQESAYTGELTDSTVWKPYIIEASHDGEDDVVFKGSVFGYAIGAGSASATTDYKLETASNGGMHVAALNMRSKISGNATQGDGFAMYYYKLPADQKFTLSARAYINDIDLTAIPTQIAFGLMARDDMYVDKYDNTLSTDYVVAGSRGSGTNCFYRKSGNYSFGAALSKENSPAKGEMYDLTLVGTGNGFICTFGEEDSQSGGYDFMLQSVDAENMYIGMFASRFVDVTYTNIYLEVDGKVLADTRKADHTVTVTSAGNGTVSASRSIAAQGDEITLTPVGDAGYVFKEWQVKAGGVEIENNKFTMPDADVELEAIFQERSSVTRTIDVWDFAGKTEEDTEVYSNYITKKAWEDLGDSKFTEYKTRNCLAAETTTFGDLTMNHTAAGDRLYMTMESGETQIGIAASSWSAAVKGFDDGYKSSGAWYCNGSGTDVVRSITIANVQAGDKIVAYIGNAGSAASTVHFVGLKDESGDASEQSDSETIDEASKFEFIAEYTGTYKIYCGKDSGFKPVYYRVKRIPGVVVTGNINYGEYNGTGHGLKFMNKTTKQEIEAELNEDGTFEAVLPAGYEYTAMLTGATGWGFTNSTKNLATKETDGVKGIKDVVFDVETKSTYKFFGTVKGFADGYLTGKNLVITMVPEKDTGLDPVDLTIDSDSMGFEAMLEPDVNYTITLSGVNDYEVKGDIIVNKNEAYEADIEVQTKPVYAVSGDFFGAEEGKVTALTLTNVEDGYRYTADVTDAGYSVKLRDGSYLATATADGYKTETHVVVNGKDLARDLYFVSTIAPASLERVSDIYVGYPDKANNYATVNEAVEACARMNPTSEAERITVHIAPGEYTEQIVINTPYISFVNDTDKEVVLTWYYGIGYKYYSSDNGFYSAAKAYDKFDKQRAAKWGTTVYIQSGAKAFRAEGITFENSFNRRLTQAEFDDGVELLLDAAASSITTERNLNLDVTSKAATERATVLVVEADETEYKDCSFLSSQDTVYTAGKNAYFKECVIEGQTDYIFGSGDAVFDVCELRWKGYSDEDKSYSGYITAHSPKSNEKGYLFRNCTVTGNAKLTVAAGYYGRPWGAKAAVTFMNTRLQSNKMLDEEGWSAWNPKDSSSAQPENAAYAEYNTTLMDGTAVDMSKRKVTPLTDEQAAAVKADDYFGTWVPAFFTAEAETVEFTIRPFITDNGDLLTPYPGHKLTVGYSLGSANDANDASLIKWYRVKEGAEDVLVKSSAASVDKTYKITAEDVGSQIKVIVTPMTVSGKTGTDDSYITENAVREGYEDPDASAADAELGDGVNIFLAGDSTVCNYAGRNEGSWGEALQNYFDKEKVTIVNHAVGGRSSRSFINEGRLDEIAKDIKAGDYLFVQFGHNDCWNSGAYPDRYVPLGTAGANGIYPSTPGVAGDDGKYPNGGAGTYKWFLQQYIDVAKNAGAIPVLVTPVSRMNYDSNGKIKAQHDDENTSNNAYVTAVKQLAEEQNVLLVDAFELTKALFEKAYSDCNSAAYGTQLMFEGDKTHCNKMGGMIEAAAIVSVLQDIRVDEKPLNITYAVKHPSAVSGQTKDNKSMYTVSVAGKFTAYNVTDQYETEAEYWSGIGQEMMDVIGEKAEALKDQNPENPDPVNPDPVNPDPVNPDPVNPDPVNPDPVNPDPVNPDPVNPDPVNPDPVNPDPVNPDPVNPDPVNPDPVKDGSGLVIRFADANENPVYTGSAITPAVLVTNDGIPLTEDVDYTVKYSNNINASGAKPATVVVTGKGNLAGKYTLEFTIKPRPLAEVTAGDITVVSGSKAEPVLIFNGVKLTAKDYTLAAPQKKYTAEDTEMVLTGKGNFTGERKLNVSVVEQGQLKKFKVTVSKDTLVYDGDEKKPSSITVTEVGSGNPLGADAYEVFYPEDITNAGTVKFSVIGKGYYSGSYTGSYKVKPLAATAEVDDKAVDRDGYSYDPNGVEIGQHLTVKVNGKVLTEGRDYKITYSGNKKVGTAKYKFTFLGNYKGTKAEAGSFTINPASLEELKTAGVVKVLAVDKSCKKDGVYKSVPYVSVDNVAVKKSELTITYYIDKDMTTEMSKTNPVRPTEGQPATVYVKIQGKKSFAGKGSDDFIRAEYKVWLVTDKSLDLGKAKILDQSTGKKIGKLSYTGEEVAPEKITVMIGSNTVPEDAYEVHYINNVNKGTATVVVTAAESNKAGYGGGKAMNYSIVTRDMNTAKK